MLEGALFAVPSGFDEDDFDDSMYFQRSNAQLSHWNDDRLDTDKQKRFSTPVQLFKTVERAMKFSSDNVVLNAEPDLKKNILIRDLITQLTKSVNSGIVPIDLLSKLYKYCDEEHAFRQFVQSNGVVILHEAAELYLSDLFYRQFYIIDNEMVDKALVAVNASDCDDSPISAMLKLLDRLSSFEQFGKAAEEAQLQRVLIMIFNLSDGYLSIKLGDYCGSDKEMALSLTKINRDENYLFTKRVLPNSMIGCPLNVYEWNSPAADDILKITDGQANCDEPKRFLSKEQTIEQNALKVSCTKNVKLTYVVDDQIFWAIEAQQQSEILKELALLLKRVKLSEIEFYVELPRLGALVLSPLITAMRRGTEGLGLSECRALIIAFTEPGLALLFAVDYGVYYKTAWKHLRKLPYCFQSIEAAAFLCVAKNSVPAFDDSNFLLLVNVIKRCCGYALLAEKFAKEAHFILCLSKYLKFWRSKLELADKIALLSLTLSNNSRVKSIMVETQFVELLIEILLESLEFLEQPMFGEFILHCLQCLSNLCDSNISARRIVEKSRGIAIPQALMSYFPADHALHIASRALLKNLLTEKACTNVWEKAVVNMCSRDEYLSRPVDIYRLLADSNNRCYSEHRGACTNELLKEYIEEADGVEAQEPVDEDLINNISPSTVAGKYYLKNSEVEQQKTRDYEESLWEYFSDETDLSTLTTLAVQSYVCAALNSRTRLIMYYGIRNDSSGNRIVEGLVLNEMQCDELRVGADFALSKAFRPILQPHLYHIRFVPVFESIDNKFLRLTDTYVVEIHVLHVDYRAYQLEENGKIFMKCEETSHPYECNMMHALSALAEEVEREQMENIRILTNALNQLCILRG